MKYLLDTHVLLWHLEYNPTLSQKLSDEIESLANDITISSASLWEITIKLNTGKLTLEEPLDAFIQRIHHAKIDILEITTTHLLTLHSLPMHHRDPFDRLIIAQSLAEQLTLISKDSAFDSYKIGRLWY